MRQRRRRRDYTTLGKQLFATTCAECHGENASGGGSAPTLNSKEFLSSTSDDQIHALVSGGVSGTDMAAWGLDFGGTLTDEQVRQVVTYLRSLEPNAPSIPDWRTGATAPAAEQQARGNEDDGEAHRIRDDPASRDGEGRERDDQGRSTWG